MTPITIEHEGITATITVRVATIYNVTINGQSIESTNIEEAVAIAKKLINDAKHTNKKKPALG